MLFPNKPRLLINNDLIFRCERLVIDENDCLVTDSNFEWSYASLYEVRFDTNVGIYVEGACSYDMSIRNIILADNVTFCKGDKLVCVNVMNYHSINGISDLYFDYEVVRYQLNTPYTAIPDAMFAEVVQLNELEYIDYLYGRD